MRALIVLFLLWAAPVWAVEPNEMLDDPVLEERAREISQLVRCPVCQNESVDESHATVARDLRVIIRERLVAGDTDQQVLDYLSARFGEFVLLTPPRDGANLLLWLAAPTMFVLALGIGWTAVRRKPKSAQNELSDDEQAELDKILNS